MKNTLKSLALISALTLSASSYAGVSATGSIVPIGDNWLPTPQIATGSGLSVNFVVGEGFATGTTLAQTFTVNSPFTLATASIYGGGGPGNVTLNLYDLGTGLVAPNPSPYTIGTSLWGAGAGLTIAIGNQATSILQFDFTGADQVSLLAGHMYAFQLSSSDATTPFFWQRTGAAASTYADGAAYRNAAWINNNNAREFSLALYNVPEPTSMAILGMGALFGAFRLRRQRK